MSTLCKRLDAFESFLLNMNSSGDWGDFEMIGIDEIKDGIGALHHAQSIINSVKIVGEHSPTILQRNKSIINKFLSGECVIYRAQSTKYPSQDTVDVIDLNKLHHGDYLIQPKHHKVNWDLIHEDWVAMATDLSGKIHLYASVPIIDEFTPQWIGRDVPCTPILVNHGLLSIFKEESIVEFGDAPWEESLVVRPKIKD